jgi:hypothetical protein
MMLVGLMLALTFEAGRASDPPEWWIEQEVLNAEESAHDYAAANIGQLKAIAAKGVEAMNAWLPGGAGEELNQLLASWREPAEVGQERHDYAALTHGQLKAVAKMFYDRLADYGYTGPPLSEGRIYPWTESGEDDVSFAVVNLGQVKFLFSFGLDLIMPPDPNDVDGDGLPDLWEQHFFGTLSNGPTDDPDGDGVTNLQEYVVGRNPIKGAIGGTPTALNLWLYLPRG